MLYIMLTTAIGAQVLFFPTTNSEAKLSRQFPDSHVKVKPK